MSKDIFSIISQIRAQEPEFASSYTSYKKDMVHWRKKGFWKDEFVQGKTVLDWECGRGVFAAIFLEMGARHVVGIDTWLDTDYSSRILSRLPDATFRRISIKEFRAVTDCEFDFVFANTVTEHLIDLPQQLIACWDLMSTNGILFVNHDHYYQPVGSHDHGFLFYGESNRMVFKGPKCWSDPRKCEASEQFRQSIIERFPWTWDEQTESLLDSNACDECPYYKRSRPWAHLIYQDEFRRIFPQVCFTTGYEKSSLNKVTTFQLRQFIIEAGFDIESWVPNIVANKPPHFLTKPPYNFNPDELRTCTVIAVCRRSSVTRYSRPFGSSISSESDPKGLTHSLPPEDSFFVEGQVSNNNGALLSPTRQQLLAQVEHLAHELETIKSSYTWRLGQKMALSPLGPAALRLLQTTQQVWSFAIKSWVKLQRLLAKKITRRDLTQQASQPVQLSAEEKKWLERVCTAEPTAIAVLHPDWRGIRSSTLNLFSAYRFVDDTLNESKALHIAQLLAETGCERVVLSGFPLSHRYLVTSLRKIAPQIKVYVLWHGSFLQSYEDYVWQGFRIIQELCQNGLIYKWGFVKKGMAEAVAKTGLRTGFVLNYVKDIPEGPSIPLEGGPHLGIWGVPYNWRKLPYAMLASTLLIPGAKIHSSAVDSRTREFAQIMGIDWKDFDEHLIPQDRMPTVLAQMHLNFNVTLSECAPMLPLESLSVGTPCLLGPNSHLFEDQQFLHKVLVVPYPDSAKVIAEHAVRALAERDKIIEAYKEYAPGYNERAQQTLAEFLEL